MQAAGEAGAATQQALSVHNFSEKLSEQMVHFHVLRMKDSFFLWVGSTPTLSNLAVAMCTKFDPMPVSTLILGDSSDTTPNSVAQRLAKKTGKQVFISYNLPSTNTSLSLQVENRIKEEMKAHPDKF
ncbi:proteasome assembly chaperone 4 isoform X1 [Chiloscyllium plagiosum]|uniref:proteasome assembly chaperone 4 isoform X1 n=1 Tax=Chiloscyllium plagiosum TaxID=36176 RepID=UPI001CB86722|nr:proteasome assembly chaperone 4 isoform X1 [Chiloscyllium plagiosum]